MKIFRLFIAQVKLCVTVQCHGKYVFCTFLGETLYDFYKRAQQSAKFQTFDCSGEISPNLYFDRLLLLKVYKVSAKKSMEELCLMIPKSGAKFEEKLIFCFKNDKNLVNFDPSTKKSKKFAL